VADVLRTGGRQVVGFLDDDPDLAGGEVAGIPVIGVVADALHAAKSTGSGVVVGLSDNIVRGRLFRSLAEAGVQMTHAVHPAAVIATDVEVPEGVVVMAGAVVNTRARLGVGCVVNTAASVDHDCVLGRMAQAMPGAILTGGVVVEDFATVGAGAVVLPRKRVGVNAFVGAGAVVTRDVAANAVVVGVPARILRSRPVLPAGI
jgi:UDP-perosamine 4-acetyltransferase